MILKKLLRREEERPPMTLRPDLIVVGLGNPEPNYARTRHNAGWWLVDLLAEKHDISVGRAHSTTRLGVGSVGEYTVALAKPRTHVNGSGAAIRYLLARFRTTQDRLLIVYDETALPPGKLRLRPRGSAAGHNGVKSIIEATRQPGLRPTQDRRRSPADRDRHGWLGPRRDVRARPGPRGRRSVESCRINPLPAGRGRGRRNEQDELTFLRATTPNPFARQRSPRIPKMLQTSAQRPSPAASRAGDRTPP